MLHHVTTILLRDILDCPDKKAQCKEHYQNECHVKQLRGLPEAFEIQRMIANDELQVFGLQMMNYR